MFSKEQLTFIYKTYYSKGFYTYNKRDEEVFFNTYITRDTYYKYSKVFSTIERLYNLYSLRYKNIGEDLVAISRFFYIRVVNRLLSSYIYRDLLYLSSKYL